MISETKIRAAGEILHKAAVHNKWAGEHYNKTYAELETTDPIGFEEFNDLVAAMLEAAEKV
jgi:hypothetical protein